METEKDWYEGLLFLLFAVHDAVQESLGFCPPKRVFNHIKPRPLKILGEQCHQHNIYAVYNHYVSSIVFCKYCCMVYITGSRGIIVIYVESGLFSVYLLHE